jgi:NAD(P)-dependent dehydrogenase (short-subunit alcohol dehydrogenase family)
MFDSNLETARVALQALLPAHGRTARAGAIVVIGSRAAERPWESAGAGPAYAAAKAAVVTLGESRRGGSTELGRACERRTAQHDRHCGKSRQHAGRRFFELGRAANR